MMIEYTQVIRFSLQVEEGVEWFCAQWIGPRSGGRERRYFPQVSRFRSWLVGAQGYGLDEADALIAQLRHTPAGAADPTPWTPEWSGRAAD